MPMRFGKHQVPMRPRYSGEYTRDKFIQECKSQTHDDCREERPRSTKISLHVTGSNASNGPHKSLVMPWYVFQLTLQRRSPFRTTRTQYPPPPRVEPGAVQTAAATHLR